MLSVLLLFCAVILSFTLMSYMIFWYEVAHDVALEEGDPRRFAVGGSWSSLARGIFSGFLSLGLVVLLYPWGLWRALWKSSSAAACSLPPVILVHGLFHNPSAWIVYRWWLKRAGFANTYALSYNSWKHSFPEILKQLETLVKEVRDLCPGAPVILIGHSLGGLLCRAYAEQADDQGRIGAVITLGAPHQGSKLTVFGLGALARSLAFRGSLILDIERKRKPLSIPCLAVYSPVDNMVLPREALRIPYSGWDYHETAPISHVSLLYHKPTAVFVISKIKAIHAIHSEKC
jgi:pimeloyl-ACP methyl ester carboxylesterase